MLHEYLQSIETYASFVCKVINCMISYKSATKSSLVPRLYHLHFQTLS